ncbi:hypothetical protein [Reyranella sp.]|uniref:hypothetical protein n=1 Tax=Reyranella sp. TaxID=1929291 RepID=UPI003F71FBA5
MFKSKTVFVLGAGASCEVALPVGAELARIIQKRVNIEWELGQFVPNGADIDLFKSIATKFGAELNEYMRAGQVIREGILLANSIDDFLDRHNKNERVVQIGKLAIVGSILAGERASHIFTSNHKPRDARFILNNEKSWYVRFLRLLGTGVNKDRLSTLFENVAFVDFNYDRCLQHFLVEALQPLYDISEQEARAVVATLKVLHPYGSLGDLTGNNSVPYGATYDRIDVFEVAERIRLYTEQINEHDQTIPEIKRTIGEAQRIVFLGFGFHRQNMDIVRPPTASARSIVGTAFGLSEEDRAVIQQSMGPLLGSVGMTMDARTGRSRTYLDHIHLPDLTSAQLFERFGQTLMS